MDSTYDNTTLLVLTVKKESRSIAKIYVRVDRIIDANTGD